LLEIILIAAGLLMDAFTVSVTLGLSVKNPKVNKNPFQLITMLLLVIATSLDATAAGITFAFFEIIIY